MTSVSEKVAVHLESRILLIDNRLADMMLLKTLAVVDYFGRDEMYIWVLYDDIKYATLGKIALIVGAMGV